MQKVFHILTLEFDNKHIFYLNAKKRFLFIRMNINKSIYLCCILVQQQKDSKVMLITAFDIRVIYY